MKTILYISTAVILLSLWLLVFKAGKLQPAVFPLVFFLLTGLCDLSLFFSESSYPGNPMNFVFLVYLSLLCLSGAVFFLYISSVEADCYSFEKKQIRKLLPLFIFLPGLVIATLIIAFQYDGHTNDHFQTSVYGIRNFSRTQSAPGPLKLLVTAFYLLFLGYIAAALFRYIGLIKAGHYLLVLSGQRFVVYWIACVFVFIFTGFAGKLDKVITSFQPFINPVLASSGNLQVISGVGHLILLISILFFPAILIGLPRLRAKPDQILNYGQVKVQSHSGKFKYNPGSEQAYSETIHLNMERCMVQLKPFLQTRFNLRELSVLMNIPTHHLAWYFRQKEKKCFEEYRDRLRLQHTKKCISHWKSGEMNLRAIGLLSGFPSYVSFFAACRKYEKKRPAQLAALIRSIPPDPGHEADT